MFIASSKHSSGLDFKENDAIVIGYIMGKGSYAFQDSQEHLKYIRALKDTPD